MFIRTQKDLFANRKVRLKIELFILSVIIILFSFSFVLILLFLFLILINNFHNKLTTSLYLRVVTYAKCVRVGIVFH